ncbi:MAG: hypothetical protein HRU70_00280 [Phycisphaeraceae bacterium]|nr:MAG: hypothetical protein HRU70_00280 [Phycisphaeraceae bacterium]
MRLRTRRPLRLSRAATPLLMIGGGFALLIWMKLRLVTGVPRTVYAEPPAPPPRPVSSLPEGGGVVGGEQDAQRPRQPAPGTRVGADDR